LRNEASNNTYYRVATVRWQLLLLYFAGGVALAAFALLQAEIITLGEVTSFKVLAVAFAAGFSDRLVTRAAGSLADRASGVQGPAPTGERAKSE